MQGEEDRERKRDREREKEIRIVERMDPTIFRMILDDKNEFLRYNLHTTTSINELRFLGNCAVR